MSIEVRHISKAFGEFVALEDISLTISTGELVALLGPSGSGKTTLLRVIAGLESPDRGSVSIEGQDITDSNVRDRRVGFVFQHYALFRQMTVFENIAFGLRVISGTKSTNYSPWCDLSRWQGVIPPSCQAASASAWR